MPDSALSPAAIESFFARLAAAHPNPRTELNFYSPFTLLVAVMLSAQATDKAVNKVTQGLFAVADTPEKILQLGQQGIEEHIKSIGLYRNKTKHLLATAAFLLEKYQGEVPRNRQDLEGLPGVGRKTANVILNTAFGEPTIAVDTHVFRVSNRTGLAPGKNVQEVEDNLLKVVPDHYRLSAHHWLILHGRYTCMARKPDCAGCLVNDLCLYVQKV
jgi:endonuclease-3